MSSTSSWTRNGKIQGLSLDFKRYENRKIGFTKTDNFVTADDVALKTTVIIKQVHLLGEQLRFLKSIFHEVLILDTLSRHQQIAPLTDIGIISDNLYIAQERYRFTLKSLMSSPTFVTINSQQKTAMVSQIIGVIAYIHQQHIVHRNISPTSISVDDNLNLKLNCFETSRYIDVKSKSAIIDETFFPQRKTLIINDYTAPEIILEHGYYSYAQDIWSAGCVLVEIFKGKSLFSTTKELSATNSTVNKNNLEIIIQSIGIPSTQDLDFDLSPSAKSRVIELSEKIIAFKLTDLLGEVTASDPLLTDLVIMMLRFNPTLRPTAMQCCSHSTFSTQGISHSKSGETDTSWCSESTQEANYNFSALVSCSDEKEELENLACGIVTAIRDRMRQSIQLMNDIAPPSRRQRSSSEADLSHLTSSLNLLESTFNTSINAFPSGMLCYSILLLLLLLLLCL